MADGGDRKLGNVPSKSADRVAAAERCCSPAGFVLLRTGQEVRSRRVTAGGMIQIGKGKHKRFINPKECHPRK